VCATRHARGCDVIGQTVQSHTPYARGSLKTENGFTQTKQQLEWNDEKLPFFWGWNIHFTYDDKEYVWSYKGQITNNEGEDCTEEILKIFE